MDAGLNVLDITKDLSINIEKDLKCFKQVFLLMYNGESDYNIAKFIQTDAQEMVEISFETLRTAIRRYLKRNAKVFSAVRAPLSHVDFIRSLKEQVCANDLLNVLATIQFERLSSSYEREVISGKHNKHTSEQVKLLNEIINTMNKVRLVDKAIPNANGDGRDLPTQIRDFYSERLGTKIAATLSNLESRKKILGALDVIKAGMVGPVADAINK